MQLGYGLVVLCVAALNAYGGLKYQGLCPKQIRVPVRADRQATAAPRVQPAPSRRPDRLR